MQSSEYTDLKWVQPRAYGSGRDGKAVRYVVIHYTAGSERATSAEDGAAYDQRRTDGTSTHYFVDQDSIVQCVRTTDRANAARARGNRLGIQYELCGTAQTRAQWLDAASLATLKLAARQVARDCRKYGIPVRRLSVAETRRAWTEFPNGPRGIVGHVDCTNAYPEDGGDHTDPGPQFPWDVFLDLVRAEMAPAANEEDDVALTADDKKWIEGLFAAAPAKNWAHPLEDPASTKTPKSTKSAGAWVRYNDALHVGTRATLLDALRAYDAGDDAALAELRAQVEALPTTIASALPIKQIADRLAPMLPAVSRAELEGALRSVLGSLDDVPAA